MKKILLVTISLTFFIFSNAQIMNEALGSGAGANITSGDYNVMLGDSAGFNHTSGINSVMVGAYAGYNNYSAWDNIFIGAWAGFTNRTGTDNIFIGTEAGYFNTGTDNVFIGTEAGEYNTTGFDNTFIGEEAGTSNTTGGDNVFVGEDAGYNNIDGDDNTFIGSTAGRSNQYGKKNTAVGNEALYDVGYNLVSENDYEGNMNTAVGDSAGTDVGLGFLNTFIGQAAGAATEYADFNTFIGARAGWDNNRTNSTSNANRNTYVGYYTGYSNREGEDNVGMGAFSDFTNTVRSRTTFIGADIDVRNNDLIAIGYSADNQGLYSIAIGNQIDVDDAGKSVVMGYMTKATSTADQSVSIGAEGNIEGNNSIGIGYSTNVTGENSIAIGSQVTVAADNEVYIGNSSTSSIGGVVNWTAASDGRFKTGVTENVPGLDFIDLLRPVSYHFNTKEMYSFYNIKPDESMETSIQKKDDEVYTGFVAQEVAEAAKASGFDFSGVKIPSDPEKEMYGLRYAEFVVPLVKATQELHQKIQEQEQIIASQQNEINDYKETLLSLSKRLETLEINYQIDKSNAGITAKK